MIGYDGVEPIPAGGYTVEIYDEENDEIVASEFTPSNFYFYMGDLPDGSYTITVYTNCDDGTSSGASSTVVVGGGGNEGGAECEDVSNIEFEDNGDGTFTITWDEPEDTPEGYDIEIFNLTIEDFVGVEFTTTNSFTTEEVVTVTDLTSGVDKNDIQLFSIFPNPADNVVTINTHSAEGTLTLMDVTGKSVKTKTINSQSTTWNVEELPNGVYFVKYDTTEKSAVMKLIKQ